MIRRSFTQSHPMASTTTSLLLPLPSSHLKFRNSAHNTPSHVTARPISASRRDFILTTATTSLAALIIPASAHAQDIPLFGLRKKIEKVEQQAKELVKEGFETAEKEFKTAEKEVVEVEKEIENAAEGGSFSGFAQAAAVAAAEVVAIFVATSTVNGILGPEPRKS